MSNSSHDVVHFGLPALPSSVADETYMIRNATAEARAQISRIEGFKPQTDFQEREWNNSEVLFVVGQDSCSKVCQMAGNLECARDWFLFLDRCAVAQAVFPEGRCTEVMSYT